MDENQDTIELYEDCVARQRKEKKELQGKIQKLKSSVPKGDKAKKKETMEKIERLEAELEEKHAKELLIFSTNHSESNDVLEKLNGCSLKNLEEDKPDSSDPLHFKFTETEQKNTKANRRKEKKQKKDKVVEERIKEQETANKTGQRQVEADKIKRLLGERNLELVEIASDGNCLFAAVKDQLDSKGVKSSVESLRQETASLMRQHPDEFLPFLIKEGSGDVYSLEEFQEYCNRVEHTSEWGGHTEIRALSDVLQRPIEVIQATGPSILVGEDHLQDKNTLIISYHRHAYGLGEHYNSVAHVKS